MTGASITVLRALDGKALTKTIARRRDGAWTIADYDNAKHFSATEEPVTGIIELGHLLVRLEHDPHACIIRGAPLPSADLARCRRLLMPQIEGEKLIPETFEPAARRWLAVDVDSLPTPVWDEGDLVRRRAAILADYAARNGPEGCPDHLLPAPFWRVDDENELAPDIAGGIAGDADPAPIDPARDHELVCRAAISTLPAEFRGAHCWGQLTSGAGIKPGVRLRLWYWCDRPVSDAECKRWLGGSPVDTALYNPVQPHYVAAPLFKPPSLDPVPQRSGIWWRHVAEVPVPPLPEPPPPPLVESRPLAAHRSDQLARRATAYAEAILATIGQAPDHQRHPTMRRSAITLYQIAEHGLLDAGDVTRQLLAIAAAMRWPPTRIHDLLDWCRAFAATKPDLPESLL